MNTVLVLGVILGFVMVRSIPTPYLDFNFDGSDTGLLLGPDSSVSEENGYLTLSDPESSYAASTSSPKLVSSGKSGTIVIRVSYIGSTSGFNMLFSLSTGSGIIGLNVDDSGKARLTSPGSTTYGSSDNVLFPTSATSEYCFWITNTAGSSDFIINYFGDQNGTFTANIPSAEMHSFGLTELTFGNYKSSSNSYGMEGKISCSRPMNRY